MDPRVSDHFLHRRNHMNVSTAVISRTAVLFFFFVSCLGALTARQSPDDKGIASDPLLSGMEYRLIGPFRGGRSAAVCGDVHNPLRFLMGATGGGLWETTDGGNKWKNISDGFFGGSIGAVALADSDPNVIYVGGGEVTIRGNVSSGDGVWRSDDGGATWKHVGLEDSRHIPRIRVDPRDANLVYAAALGHLYGPSQQRGVFRSRDGGTTWERVLFVSDEVGACDLLLDPNNPAHHLCYDVAGQANAV